jgi:pectin lyase
MQTQRNRFLFIYLLCASTIGLFGCTKSTTTSQQTGVTKYTLTISALSNGQIGGASSGGTYALGSQVALTATPNNGYSMGSWTGDAAACGSQTSCTLTIAGNVTVGATFTANQYTLTITAPSNGVITGASSGTSYAYGTSVTLGSYGIGAYGLSAWTGDASSCGSAASCTFTINGNKTVSAAFATAPVGFGAGTTGGAGGETVTVTTLAGLKAALCATSSGGVCTDTAARIIQLAGVIDFTGSEGTTTALACQYSQNNCTNSAGKFEQILNVTSYCSGKTIYSLTYDTAGSPSNALLVGSNKTLIGIGTGAQIKGKGISISGGVSNVIIRNLSITDINDGIIWAGDAILIANASKVWIDHNYFARVGRQMIVSGWDKATDVTISNNYIDGTDDYGYFCNGKHYWNFLLLATNENFTVIGNWFHNTSGRSPEVGQLSTSTLGVVHMVNNYYDGNYYTGGINGNMYVTEFAEGNTFTSTGYYFPVALDGSSDLVVAPLAGNLSTLNSTCATLLDRSCIANTTASSSTYNTGFILSDTSLTDLEQSSSWASGIAIVHPMDVSDVATHVQTHAGPQQNPDL